MPGPRGPDRSLIEDALAALTGALSEVRAPWMVIGGIAVIAHGVQRMTTDIDAVIQGDAMTVKTLIDTLQRHQIVPRIEDAAAFAAANLVLLTRHRPTKVDLDLSFGWTAFEHEALAARARTRYGAVTAPMARVEDLLVFKAMAGRPRDIDDAVTLLTLYPRTDLKRLRGQLTELAELAETPELMQGLERIIRAAAATPAKLTPPRKPSSPRGCPSAAEKPTAETTRPRASRSSKSKRAPR